MTRLDGAHPFRFCGVGGHADQARDHPLQMVDGRHDRSGAHRFEIRQSVEHQLSRPIVVEARSVHIPERLPLWIEFQGGAFHLRDKEVQFTQCSLDERFLHLT